MAQFYFRYGTMNSGKSIDILKVTHNYEEEGKPVLLMTSNLDTRIGKGKVASRIGISHDAVAIDEGFKVFDYVAALSEKPRCILIDESQFLSKENIYDFAKIVDNLNIPVIAYGLKNDFRNELFEGSKYLLLLADKIEEIKTICWYCEKKATMVLRLLDGKPIFEGEQVQIGGNESYIPVCRKHYMNPEL
ncbi:thymidine kinase [Lactovum miscens]|uniref:Thymidine kinase n=1 Tax=Lactovum miscens TaxID=190387 RepID=A0A841C790_9LACT|nr:thymidine kinase [Lactovum miscens]MBB5888345.1 thymidine kinase [Lactovum miscens]